MTAAALHLDFELSRRRTRWTMALSIAIHTLLLFWFVTMKSAVQDLPALTEVMLLEPGDLSPSAAGSPAPIPAPAQSLSPQGLANPSKEDLHFPRMNREPDVSLEPALNSAIQDRMNATLAAQKDVQPLPVGTGTGVLPSSLFGTAPATVPGPGGTGSAPVKLNRGGSGSGAGTALDLSRGLGVGGGTSLGPASVQGGGKSAASAPARAGDATAQRTIAGASLLGPVADRPVLFYSLPVYPDWAKKEAVEGSVTLYFVVRPDGGVKENVMVQKTAGFGDFDENARTALRAWRFEPLKGGRTGEQWGTITFHFRLRSAG